MHFRRPMVSRPRHRPGKSLHTAVAVVVVIGSLSAARAEELPYYLKDQEAPGCPPPCSARMSGRASGSSIRYLVA